MTIKKELEKVIKRVRFVTSRDPILSSVIVAKNKCQEYMILSEELLVKTLAVQMFKEYSQRDYGRPYRDAKSGMLPPKLAKIMINLACLKKDQPFCDPFCGSGTILQEAVLMGYTNVIGCDVSQIAIENTRKNLEWLEKKSNLQSPISNIHIKNIKLIKTDVKNLSRYIKDIAAIVTEPYLGPPLKGNENELFFKEELRKLTELYLVALREFHKVLSPSGRVVIIFPRFILRRRMYKISLEKEIAHAGFHRQDTQEYIYSRLDQKVQREICIFQKI